MARTFPCPHMCGCPWAVFGQRTGNGSVPESCGDKLGAFSQFVNHISNGFSMSRVQSGIDLVEEVEGSWIAFLNGKDQSLNQN